MKWTIEMTAEELARKSEIERVMEKRSTQAEAACRPGISQWQMRRITRSYRQERLAGLLSKKRSFPSNRNTKASVLEVVRSFICDPR